MSGVGKWARHQRRGLFYDIAVVGQDRSHHTAAVEVDQAASDEALWPLGAEKKKHYTAKKSKTAADAPSSVDLGPPACLSSVIGVAICCAESMFIPATFRQAQHVQLCDLA